MRIVHIYAKNLQMFVDAVDGTDCKLNASVDLDYMIGSLPKFNARDVVGLVVFANPMTKKCIRLIEEFDKLFVFRHMPIVVINDDATGLWESGFIHVKNSKVFVLDSEENSISDVDVSSVFTTLFAFNDNVHDLSVIPAERDKSVRHTSGEVRELQMSQQLADLLQILKERGTA